MSPRQNDRNRVVMGPARLNAEQEIYQAVDRGAVTATTPATVPEEGGGGIVIPPAGDLITPPAINAVEGFPILNSEIFGTATSPISNTLGSSWGIVQAADLGLFQNTLILRVSNSDIRAYNLDNPGQYVILPEIPSTPTALSSAAVGPVVRRDASIYIGMVRLSGSTWVADPLVAAVPGGFISVNPASENPSVTFSNVGAAMSASRSPYAGGLSYALLPYTGTINSVSVSGWGVFVFTTVGTLTIAPVWFGTTAQAGNPQRPLPATGIHENTMYFVASNSSTGQNLMRRLNVQTGVITTLSVTGFLTSPYYWINTDGSLSAITATAAGGYHALYTWFPDDTVLVQSTYITTTAYSSMAGSAGFFGAPLLQYGNQSSLLVPEVGTTSSYLRQLTSVGYQDVPFPFATYENGQMHWKPGEEATTLRWTTGTIVGGTTTDVGLYEGAI